MPGNARKLVHITKLLVAAVCVFSVSWIAGVSVWHSGGWRGRRVQQLSTMRTIVGYSAGKLAEMERPSPVTCNRMPAFPHVPKINRTWSPGAPPADSWQDVPQTSVSLYAAFYDRRWPQPYIRILATFYGRNYPTEVTLFCQTRLLDPTKDTVEVVAAKPMEIWWHKWNPKATDVETPLLLSCPLTEPLNGPSVVSVVTEPCDDPSNAFAVEPVKPSQWNSSYKRKFTVCVKDMDFRTDISQNLLEWLETNKILGVDKIDMYIDELSVNNVKVLSHYRDVGYVSLFHVPIKNKPGRSLWQRRRDHIVTYNDCLYRNIAESEYIVPLDVDEIILPKIGHTWRDLLQRLEQHGWNSSINSAINVQNVFFFDFQQGIKKYNREGTNKSKVYRIREDVPIPNTHVKEIELLDDVDTSYNKVIDNKQIDKILREKYKSRCGHELPEPKIARHIIRSATASANGEYSKSLIQTKRFLTVSNHYPLNKIATPVHLRWAPPFEEVQLNHYKESCNSVLMDCETYERRARVDTAAAVRLRNDLIRALASAICTPRPLNNT